MDFFTYIGRNSKVYSVYEINICIFIYIYRLFMTGLWHIIITTEKNNSLCTYDVIV